ncbi:TlpA family protein disulfide reductase [Niabella pedocola]|uniref:TlpA family protein disulfide reductase n=1 Tax=Niabella pedocola TaxID=1752077 RepID=A0ABS8PU49_9BACT|nr:TlpA family protein disulfide reductase [Niabella pedocola]MCD2424390.1 TlpA family protein disulfide reductase [Niabella pedocola]
MIKYLLAYALAGACLYAQAQDNIKPLTIGDTVPDITFTNIINHPTQAARLSDFGGRPVVLDFFATWCSSCIAALPHLDNLQQQFSNKIQLFVVTYEPKENLHQFFKNVPLAQKLRLPFIYGDTVLKQLFPHKSIPHEVIISQNKVAAITFPEYITGTTFQRLLQDQAINPRLKQDLDRYTPRGSLYDIATRQFWERLISSSTFTGFIEGIGSKSGVFYNPDSTTKKIYKINLPLISFYTQAYNLPAEKANRVLLEVADPSPFFRTKAGIHEWLLKGGFCYEATVPKTMADSVIYQNMLHTINKSLGYRSYLQTRQLKCYVLRLVTGAAVKTSTGGAPVANLLGNANTKTLRNQPIQALVDAMNNQTPADPLCPIVLDETGIHTPIDLDLKVADVQDLSAMSRALKPYGLELAEVVRPVEVLVIQDYHTDSFILKARP